MHERRPRLSLFLHMHAHLASTIRRRLAWSKTSRAHQSCSSMADCNFHRTFLCVNSMHIPCQQERPRTSPPEQDICSCGSPCRGDGSEDAGRGVWHLVPPPAAALAGALCVPADAKAIPIQVAIGQVRWQVGVHLALPCIIGLLYDGPVRPQHHVCYQHWRPKICHEAAHAGALVCFLSSMRAVPATPSVAVVSAALATDSVVQCRAGRLLHAGAVSCGLGRSPFVLDLGCPCLFAQGQEVRCCQMASMISKCDGRQPSGTVKLGGL